MQDLGKIELRFICYQNWDNSEKMRLASNLNAGRVDGVDAVVESVSFELIPLSASIYKQTQEYSGTSTSEGKKLKEVKLKISVNDKGLASSKVRIRFSLLSGDSNEVNIELSSEGNTLGSISLSSTRNDIKFDLGKIDKNGVFNMELTNKLIYSGTPKVRVEPYIITPSQNEIKIKKDIEILLK